MTEGVSLSEAILPSGAVMLIQGEIASGPRDVGMESPIDLLQLRQHIAEFADVLVGALESVTIDEAELEFSVGVELETGRVIAFLARGKAQTGVSIRLTWKRRP